MTMTGSKARIKVAGLMGLGFLPAAIGLACGCGGSGSSVSCNGPQQYPQVLNLVTTYDGGYGKYQGLFPAPGATSLCKMVVDGLENASAVFAIVILSPQSNSSCSDATAGVKLSAAGKTTSTQMAQLYGAPNVDVTSNPIGITVCEHTQVAGINVVVDYTLSSL